MPYPDYLGRDPEKGRRKLALLCAEQGWRCCYCGRRFVDHISRRQWKLRLGYRDPRPSVEHIVRIADGGQRIYDNEVAACRGCNVARGTRDALEFYEIAKAGPEAVAALCGKDDATWRPWRNTSHALATIGEVVAMTPGRRAYFEMTYPGVRLE